MSTQPYMFYDVLRTLITMEGTRARPKYSAEDEYYYVDEGQLYFSYIPDGYDEEDRKYTPMQSEDTHEDDASITADNIMGFWYIVN